MPNLNKVQLMGNLTRAPELRYTPKGAAVAEFGMAINRKWTDESGESHEETTFVDVTVWGKRGETLHKYVRKGHPLYIEGRLHLDQWEDKTTGQQRSRLKVIGESFQFLGSGGKGKESRDTSHEEDAGAGPEDSGDPAGEDDIPF